MELLDFVRFGINHNIEVRFIEAMPFNDDDGNKRVFLPSSEIYFRIKKAFPSFEKLAKDGSSSDNYLVDGKYKIGIIPAYTRSLCSACNRIRLTPKGELLTCLYAQTGIDLLGLVRDENQSDLKIENEIKKAVKGKLKDGYEEEKKISSSVFRSMTTIGG